MKKTAITLLSILCASGGMCREYVSQVWNPDRGDGTYTNPVIHADYSDPDVIRVGDDYYMTASSFNCVPGLPILHSRDLVNWRIVGHALRELQMEGVPEGFFDRPQHGRGVWAPCLRHHKGEYMIYWGDPDFGIYVVKTRDILGRWDDPILVLPGRGRIDPSPLFDDDGRVYLVHAWAASRSRFNSVLTVCELNADGTRVIGEEALVFDGNNAQNHTIEGAKFHKRDGWYYILAPAGGVATGWQIALRSRNVYGPYEVKRVLEQGSTAVNGPHQGALVDSPDGEWWFAHFQDKGVYGRIIHLQPVDWRTGWPSMGIDGQPVPAYRKPCASAIPQNPQESDEFDDPRLGLQWQWHANPGQAWAFPSTEGYIRLYGQYYPDGAANLWDVPNLLMQKWPAPAFTATMKLTAVLKNPGDKAGLIHMGFDYGWLALAKTEDGYAIEHAVCRDADQRSPEQIVSEGLTGLEIVTARNHETPLEKATIYLRLIVAEGGVCRFAYSTDGRRFREFGDPFTARQGRWIGAKCGFAVMNKTQDSDRSWIDVDWFRITKSLSK